MIQSTQLSEVIDTLQRDSALKFDFTSDIRRVGLAPTKDPFSVRFRSEFGPKGGAETDLTEFVDRDYAITTMGWQKLCTFLSIPNADWLRSNPQHIVALVLNHWAKVRGDQGGRTSPNAFVRTKGGRVRAVLSDRFVPLDDDQIASALGEAMGDRKIKTEVRHLYRDEGSTSLKITFPDLTRDFTRANGITETHRLGTIIRNSEVGNSSVRISPFVYRFSCTNDLIVEKEFSLDHQHRGITRKWLVAAMEDAVSHALKDGDAVLQRFEASDKERIGEPLETLKNLMLSGRYSDKHTELVVEEFNKEPGNTKMDLVNAITAAARRMRESDNVPKALEMEAFAGKVLYRPLR